MTVKKPQRKPQKDIGKGLVSKGSSAQRKSGYAMLLQRLWPPNPGVLVSIYASRALHPTTWKGYASQAVRGSISNTT